MRKIVAGLFVSLDGVYEAPENWHFPYFNDEMGDVVNGQIADSDTMLFGRQTFQEFAAYWPKQGSDVPLAAVFNAMPKLVASTTLESVDSWQNSTLIRGDLATELRRIKAQAGKDINVTGSGKLVCSLLSEGLLDELRLLVHPILVGSGKRLFGDATDRVPLELLDERRLSTGVLSLTYTAAA